MKAVITLGVALAVAGAAATAAILPAPQARAGTSRPACHVAEGQALVPAGVVALGEDGLGHPGQSVRVAPFRIDRHEVTNRQFAAFVTATGYRTQAEREGRSAVFVQPTTLDSANDAGQWWRFVKGASWRRPTGVENTPPSARADLPVVQVTYEDAQAYALWVGGRWPTEAEWERAARGDQVRPVDPAHWAYDAARRPLANTWQGVFPLISAPEDGYPGLAPVGCFPANAFGLNDMIGNAWEWTTTTVAGQPGSRTLKGGSFLCSFNYCANFRPAGWQAQEEDLATSHIGVRVVRDAASIGREGS